jgi:hypothetical protein
MTDLIQRKTAFIPHRTVYPDHILRTNGQVKQRLGYRFWRLALAGIIWQINSDARNLFEIKIESGWKDSKTIDGLSEIKTINEIQIKTHRLITFS